MDFIKTGGRIKYYRDLLHINQKELAMGRLTPAMIRLLENNKKRLTPITASILISNFHEIANEKGVRIDLEMKDFLMSDMDYANSLCSKWIREGEEGSFNENRYFKIFELAKEFNLYEHIIKAYEKLYLYYYDQRKYSEALTYINASLPAAELLNDPETKINVINRNGTCNYMLMDYEKAFFYYKQAYDEFLKYNPKNPKLENKLLYNLALVSLERKNYVDAEIYIDKALSLTGTDDSSVYLNLIIKANLFLATDKLQEALDLYKKILSHDIKYLYTIENNMGVAFIRLGKLDESIEIYTKSINKQIDSLTPTTTKALSNIALVYFKKMRFKEAITFYEYALNNARKFQQLDIIIQCYEKLLNICNETDKIDQFDNYHKSMLDLYENTILNENQLNKLNAIEHDYIKSVNSEP